MAKDAVMSGKARLGTRYLDSGIRNPNLDSRVFQSHRYCHFREDQGGAKVGFQL